MRHERRFCPACSQSVETVTTQERRTQDAECAVCGFVFESRTLPRALARVERHQESWLCAPVERECGHELFLRLRKEIGL